MILVFIISVIVALCFLIVMFGNPFQKKLQYYLKKESGHHKKCIRLFSFNKANIYFYEYPYGVTGVIYEDTLYIYDKHLNVTKCGGSNYDSVFEMTKDTIISKCFMSETLIRKIFENAPIKEYLNITDRLKSNFLERAKQIVSVVRRIF